MLTFFLSKFGAVFDKGSNAEAAGHRLLNLKQGKHSISSFAIEIWTLAKETEWGQEMLKSALFNNVNKELKDELIMCELPTSLDAIMTLWIQVDNWLQAHRRCEFALSESQWCQWRPHPDLGQHVSTVKVGRGATYAARAFTILPGGAPTQLPLPITICRRCLEKTRHVCFFLVGPMIKP